MDARGVDVHAGFTSAGCPTTTWQRSRGRETSGVPRRGAPEDPGLLDLFKGFAQVPLQNVRAAIDALESQ
jgi:hypothetical protein